MTERVVVVVDEDLAELLREHLPRIADALRREPTAGFTIAEAAYQMRVSATTVKQMISRGDIRPVHFGTRVVVPRTEVDRVLGATVASPVRRVG